MAKMSSLCHTAPLSSKVTQIKTSYSVNKHLKTIPNYLSIYTASSDDVRVTRTELKAEDVIRALQHQLKSIHASKKNKKIYYIILRWG